MRALSAVFVSASLVSFAVAQTPAPKAAPAAPKKAAPSAPKKAATTPAKKAPATETTGEVKRDRIMSIDELRVCMTMQKSNEDEAGLIRNEQAAFVRDQDAIRVEQAEVKRINDELLTRSAALRSEREAIRARVDELRAVATNAKTDAEKADYEKQREAIGERNRKHDESSAKFNADQQAHANRIDALNAKIEPLNARGKTVNDRVEPLQDKIAKWREQCGNRRFREEDEIVIKKELAAAPK